MSRIVGHYAPWLLTVLVGALITATLVPAAVAWTPWQALLLAEAAVVLVALAMFAHNRRLCDRCLAAVPLDAPEVASKYGFRFRIAHLFERKLYAFGYLGLVVGSGVFSTHPIAKYGWAAVQASLVYLLLVYITHQRLQPWCPMCKHGGEEISAPTRPTPVSSNV
jgi:hypothetical protein